MYKLSIINLLNRHPILACLVSPNDNAAKDDDKIGRSSDRNRIDRTFETAITMLVVYMRRFTNSLIESRSITSELVSEFASKWRTGFPISTARNCPPFADENNVVDSDLVHRKIESRLIHTPLSDDSGSKVFLLNFDSFVIMICQSATCVV